MVVFWLRQLPVRQLGFFGFGCGSMEVKSMLLRGQKRLTMHQ
jgi:hypothetical protein